MSLNNSPNAQKNLQNLRNYLKTGSGLSNLNKGKLMEFLKRFHKINNKGYLLTIIPSHPPGPGNRSKLRALTMYNKPYPNMKKKNNGKQRGLFSRFFR